MLTHTPYRLLVILLIVFYSLIVTLPISAQFEGIPAPQFLYRDGNHLVLVNGYTGATSQLPFEVKDRDIFFWSPDGKYIFARFWNTDSLTYCLNFYDVDALTWLYDQPLACRTVGQVVFSADGTRLVYTTTDDLNGILWLYSLSDETTQELHRTSNRSERYRSGISEIQWSPAENYLTFVDYDPISGGTINTFVVMNVKNQTYFTLNALDSYYAYYEPVWSADENWFLIRLQDHYVTSSTLPITNDEGDVYLVNTQTGDKVRLTYTPTVSEYYIGWTDDGQIAFKEWLVQETTLTLEQALNVPEVPLEDIAPPEPVERILDPLDGIRVSPDTNIGAWITTEADTQGTSVATLNIGFVGSWDPTIIVSLPLSGSYLSENILMDWRPSDYPYPPG